MGVTFARQGALFYFTFVYTDQKKERIYSDTYVKVKRSRHAKFENSSNIIVFQ